jgi:homocysteine S-methyltransferase
MSNGRPPSPWPALDSTVVTDAGLETWLVFHRGVDLPAFAAYPLVATAEGRALLVEYYEHYIAIADEVGAAVALDTPTWRANPDWAANLGHDRTALAGFVAAAVELVADLRARRTGGLPFLVSGAVGPRGDGYVVGDLMDADEAARYHWFQVDAMARSGVDVVTALTLGYVDEAVGVCRAAQAAGVPAVISFTVETDGRLASGMPLGEAVTATDEATDGFPTHYMVNCAHPTHFAAALDDGAGWTARIGGLRANASQLSHAELDAMETLDEGDPAELAARYVQLRPALPGLQVLGGCCGTDHRHVAAIAQAWVAFHG